MNTDLHDKTHNDALIGRLVVKSQEYGAKDCKEDLLAAFKMELNTILSNESQSSFASMRLNLDSYANELSPKEMYFLGTAVEAVNSRSSQVGNNAQAAEEESDDSEEPEDRNEPEGEGEGTEEDGESFLSNAGWISTIREISNLKSYTDKLKSIPYIGAIFRVGEIVELLKKGIKWLFDLIVKIVRIITLADLLDRGAKWIKENHSHRKLVVEIATLIDAIAELLKWVFFITLLALRPDKYAKKIMPEELGELTAE